MRVMMRRGRVVVVMMMLQGASVTTSSTATRVPCRVRQQWVRRHRHHMFRWERGTRSNVISGVWWALKMLLLMMLGMSRVRVRLVMGMMMMWMVMVKCMSLIGRCAHCACHNSRGRGRRGCRCCGGWRGNHRVSVIITCTVCRNYYTHGQRVTISRSTCAIPVQAQSILLVMRDSTGCVIRWGCWWRRFAGRNGKIPVATTQNNVTTTSTHATV